MATAQDKSKKNQTWEEREAKRLRNLVFDQLAYYIQVQLPEKKYVNRTTRSSYRARRPESPKTSRPPSRSKKTTKLQSGKKYKSPQPDNESKRSAETGETLSGNRDKKYSGKQHAAPRSSSSHSSASSAAEDEKKISKSDHIDGKDKNPSTTKKRKHRRRNATARPKQSLFRTFEMSPYAVDLTEKNIGRKKNAETMRKEAERVAANTTKLLNTLPLSEVVAIHKYHSETKSKLRCSSSLSQHPAGMLRSDKALEYAAKYDGRKRAKNYERSQQKKEEIAKMEEEEKRKQTKKRVEYKTFTSPTLPLMKENEQTDTSSDPDDSTESDSLSGATTHSTADQSTLHGSHSNTPAPGTSEESESSDSSSSDPEDDGNTHASEGSRGEESTVSDVSKTDPKLENSEWGTTSSDTGCTSVQAKETIQQSPSESEESDNDPVAPVTANEEGESRRETDNVSSSSSDTEAESNAHSDSSGSEAGVLPEKKSPPIGNGGVGLLSGGDISELPAYEAEAASAGDIDVESRLAWQATSEPTMPESYSDRKQSATSDTASDNSKLALSELHSGSPIAKDSSIDSSHRASSSDHLEDDVASMTSSIRRIIEESHVTLSTSDSSSSSDESNDEK